MKEKFISASGSGSTKKEEMEGRAVMNGEGRDHRAPTELPTEESASTMGQDVRGSGMGMGMSTSSSLGSVGASVRGIRGPLQSRGSSSTVGSSASTSVGEEVGEDERKLGSGRKREGSERTMVEMSTDLAPEVSRVFAFVFRLFGRVSLTCSLHFLPLLFERR